MSHIKKFDMVILDIVGYSMVFLWSNKEQASDIYEFMQPITCSYIGFNLHLNINVKAFILPTVLLYFCRISNRICENNIPVPA